VTGATGYVAGWIIKALLDANVSVHATVRDPARTDKLQHLTDLAASAPGQITFFAADLLQPGSFAEAMQGCSIVFHTASPFVTSVKDPQKDLVDPAVLGTRNVLGQADNSPDVTRVVLTSSCAAIYSDAADCANAPGGVLTEAIWNTRASLKHQPYSLSKTLAEREAWKVAEAQSQWDMVVVNPSLVIGPALNANPTSETFNLVRQLGDGKMKMGAPRFGFGAVDVRDVARAHVAAAYVPQANGRNIISGHNTDLVELSATLIEKYGDRYPIPRKAMPKWLVWLLGPIIGGISRKTVSLNVDVPWRADNSKGVAELGMSYRPLRDTMEDMFASMIEQGQFEKA
jgi:dihydroflavonol-4-reductase